MPSLDGVGQLDDGADISGLWRNFSNESEALAGKSDIAIAAFLEGLK